MLLILHTPTHTRADMLNDMQVFKHVHCQDRAATATTVLQVFVTIMSTYNTAQDLEH